MARQNKRGEALNEGRSTADYGLRSLSVSRSLRKHDRDHAAALTKRGRVAHDDAFSRGRDAHATNMRTILVTGAAGFIGSNFVRMLLTRDELGARDVKIIALDKLTYAGNLANLDDLLQNKRLVFVR